MLKLGLFILTAAIIFLTHSCALYHGQEQKHTSVNPTTSPSSSPPSSSSPSPLNTSANPWTNVNPQVQGQIARERPNLAR